MKTRHVRVVDPIYKFDVHFWHGDERVACRFITKESGIQQKPIGSAGWAFDYRTPTGVNAVHIWVDGRYRLTTPVGVSILAHECVHAAMAVFKFASIAVTDEGGQEALTHYVEWLMFEALSRLPKARGR